MFGGWEAEWQWRRYASVCCFRLAHMQIKGCIIAFLPTAAARECKPFLAAAAAASSRPRLQCPRPALRALCRHVNAQAADMDRVGWLFNAVAYSLMLVFRHWLRQGQPGAPPLAQTACADCASSAASWST